MTLRLSVVSEHGIRMGAQSSKVFGAQGGTIGRATDNDWILPDPERYLSGKHARVDFREGSYILVDTSSNGTYVNGSLVPLGKYHDYKLQDGDYVRLGEYEFLVNIEASDATSPDLSALVADEAGSPSLAARKSTANDIGADLDLSQLLEPSGQFAVDPGLGARNSYGQPVKADWGGPVSPDEDSATPWHMTTRPLKVAARGAAAPSATAPGPAAPAAGRPGVPSSAPAARAPPDHAPFDAELDAGLAALCRGAGIDPRVVSTEARGAALQLAGQLLRELVLGLMELTQSRNELRNRFRIADPRDPGAESPLNFSRGVDEALIRLLNTHSMRASSVAAIRDNFREMKAQNAAVLAAMRAAFEAFLGRVDPKDLAERFEGAAKRNMFGAQNKAKYWDLYSEMFSGLAQRPADGFPHLFNEVFAKTYEIKLRSLLPPPRSAFGPDRNDPPEPDRQAAVDL
jgi:type VI secretion system protein